MGGRGSSYQMLDLCASYFFTASNCFLAVDFPVTLQLISKLSDIVCFYLMITLIIVVSVKKLFGVYFLVLFCLQRSNSIFP